MTIHHGDLPGALPVPPPAVYPAKHPLPASDLPEFARDVVVFTPSAAHLDRLIEIASADLEGLASREPVARVINHNPDSLWGIALKSNYDAENPVPEGFVAFLMLNSDGQRALIDGTFDASAPDLRLLCAQNERPAGIYIWLVWAKDKLFPGIPLALEKVWTPLYKDADLYTRAVNPHSARLLEAMGFVHGASFEGNFNPNLHWLARSAQRVAPAGPLYDRYDGNGKPGEIAI